MQQQWPNIGPDFVERAGGLRGIGQRMTRWCRFGACNRPPPARCGAGRVRRWRPRIPRCSRREFASVVDCGVLDGRLQLIAPTRFHADYLRTHFAASDRNRGQPGRSSIRDVQIGSARG